MPRLISQETKQKAIRLYRNRALSIEEISNLTDVSVPRLNVWFREAIANGELKPRVNKVGRGRYVPTGKPRGNPNWQNGGQKKFSAEQEWEIAQDYYINGLSQFQVYEKWDCHPVQLQRVRNKYAEQFGKKQKGRNANGKICNN